MTHKKEASFDHLRSALAETMTQIEFPVGVFVTVLSAKIAANSAHASVTLSVFPDGKEEVVKDTLIRFKHDIKDNLAHRLRLRRIPDLHYTFDQTEAEAAIIEKAINELKAKGEL